MAVVRADGPLEAEARAPEGHEVLPPAPSVSPGSALGQVRARRRELRSERTKVFVIPAYGGKLAARYKPVDYGRTMEIRRGAAKRFIQDGLKDYAELYGQIDTLASGCVEVVVKDPDHQQADEDGWVGIDPEHGPVRFEQHLAELLDFADRTNGGRARMGRVGALSVRGRDRGPLHGGVGVDGQPVPRRDLRRGDRRRCRARKRG